MGHLVAASQARQQLGLDEVLLTVANDPWQKHDREGLTPATVRFDLVAAAAAGHEGLMPSDREIRRGGPTYTIDTVDELAAADSGVELVLIVGADTAAGLGSWHRADDLLAAVTVAVVDRPGAPAADPAFLHVAVPLLEISSSDIRARCADGRAVDFLVPDGVLSEMRRLHLYGLRA